MPAYYTFEKNLANYRKLAEELWYAAGGITVVTKTTLNVARGLMEEPPKQIHDQFLYAMNQEKHYDAAMLYEALIVLTEEATFIDWQISKNFTGKTSARMMWFLADATEKAYDMVFYNVYPPSRAEKFGKYWYTVNAPRKSKILHPMEVTKNTIYDIKHHLWGIVSATQPWGVRGYQDASPEIPMVRARMKNLINEALTSAERAENFARRGNFIDSAVQFTHATFLLELYFQYRKSLSGKMDAREFKEIDAETENIFNSHYNNIRDAIGLGL